MKKKPRNCLFNRSLQIRSIKIIEKKIKKSTPAQLNFREAHRCPCAMAIKALVKPQEGQAIPKYLCHMHVSTPNPSAGRMNASIRIIKESVACIRRLSPTRSTSFANRLRKKDILKHHQN